MSCLFSDCTIFCFRERVEETLAFHLELEMIMLTISTFYQTTLRLFSSVFNVRFSTCLKVNSAT